jgi:release factor glutamine methyltransferase
MVIFMKKIKSSVPTRTNSIALVSEIKEKLLPVYHDPQLRQQYAWWTLEHITGLSQAALIGSPDFQLTEEQENKLFFWLDALVNAHMPIQYLISSVPFNGLEILVKEPVLIPRPETEEWTLALCEKLQQLPHKNIEILDLCTGTGCIALTLAKHLPEANILATDISTAAVALAQKNVAHNALENITIIESDLFELIPAGQKFDLIVGNPPYISPEEWQALDRSVMAWEDKRALVADDQGLALIKKIITQTPAYIRHNKELAEKNIPHLMLEIGHTQAPAVTKLLKDAGYIQVQIRCDLEGKNRVVSGRIKE